MLRWRLVARRWHNKMSKVTRLIVNSTNAALDPTVRSAGLLAYGPVALNFWAMMKDFCLPGFNPCRSLRSVP